MKFIELFIEIISWCRIVLSPLLLGAVIGIFMLNHRRDRIGIIEACVPALIGLVIGIIWATRTWKRQGTTEFISRVNASPDMDIPDDKPQEKKK